MTHVLAIDTSTRVSVGLAIDDLVYTHHVEGATVHVERLMPSVKLLLARTSSSIECLDGIVVGLGPGPFTGLRVGIVTAQTLAATLGIPIKGVCSLDAIGRSCAATGEYIVATDARRKELYWATFVDGVRVDAPQVSRPDDLPNLPVYGPAADMYPLPDAHVTAGVDAGILAKHYREFADMGTEPLYLRRPDATEPSARKSVLP